MTHLCQCCGAALAAPSKPELAARSLPPVQAAVMRALASDFGDFVHTDRLVQRVWAEDPSGGPEWARVCLSNAVRRMRPIVEAQGLRVEGKQYLGYRLVAA